MDIDLEQPFQQLLDGTLHYEAALAAAVIRRAFFDLINPRKPKEQIDAYTFLIERLWEPDNLWGQLIAPYLEKDDVLGVVRRYIKLVGESIILKGTSLTDE